MRAARLILITVATCALVAALGTLAFAAASHDEPDLGEPVHLGTPTRSPSHPGGPDEPTQTPHPHTRPTPTGPSTGSADDDDDDDDDEGAHPAHVSPRHAGDDDDEGDADDVHDEDHDTGD